MKLFIKYMVSTSCKLLLKKELENMGISDAKVELGVVTFKDNLSPTQRKQVESTVKELGFEVIKDKRVILVERIKHVIIKAIHFTDTVLNVNFSTHLSNVLEYNYTYLANVFSKVTGTTIQRQIINQKIERVKELLLYDELTLTEIAYRLNYSSVAHLSNQFKRVTGVTPSTFKQMGHKRTKGLEEV